MKDNTILRITRAQCDCTTCNSRIWAAFAVALLMSVQFQVGVLIFWLLPSSCSTLCLLAATGGNRGIA